MQGFRGAFVITGFVMLGLGSNLAWHYPRPEALGLQVDSPRALMVASETLQSAGVRCHPEANWSDLIVESADQERAREILKGAPLTAGQSQNWETPPALLAELAHLPGVKEANVVIQEQRRAVVMLSMRHGAFAGDLQLMGRAVEAVQRFDPAIVAENIKLVDSKGADLNYSALPAYSNQARPLQGDVQRRLDGLLGVHQSQFFCRLARGKEQRIYLQSVLYLSGGPEERSRSAQELVDQTLQAWIERQNKLLKTDSAWQVQAFLYPYLGETSDRDIQRSWPLDRDNGLLLGKTEIKEWTYTQSTLPLEEMKVLQWGLTCPPPTRGQLALGLAALAPALFGWCLLLPRLLRRHQLSSSASATL